jgi:hypothetical protein
VTLAPLPSARERFLAAIALQVPPERVAEVYVFAPMRQGGTESGVAVVAATRVSAAAPIELAGDHEGDHGRSEGSALPTSPREHAATDGRHTVFTARYRWTIKGPDRGRWEVTIVEEADALLVTVESVVRGVQRRSGDVDEPDRIDGDRFREIVARAAAAAPG